MSFRRRCLEAARELKGLHGLYELRIGSAEDSVLSAAAARPGNGPLLMLTDPLAFHPPLDRAVRTADQHDGWRKGLRETLGRAHTMRWLARSRRDLLGDWLRTVVLELGRASAAVLRRPLAGAAWSRLAGGLYGSALSVALWPWLPNDPQASLRIARLPGVAR